MKTIELKDRIDRDISVIACPECNEAKKDLEFIEFQKIKQTKQGELNANTNGC